MDKKGCLWNMEIFRRKCLMKDGIQVIGGRKIAPDPWESFRGPGNLLSEVLLRKLDSALSRSVQM